MLNTDLHNTGIPLEKKMTLQQFLQNNRGINGGADLPLSFLEKLYNEIKDKQILVDNSITDGDSSVVNFADTASWQKLLFQGQSNQAPASFTPTIAARRSVSGDMDLDKMNIKYKSLHGGNGSGTRINHMDANGYATDDSTSKESENRDDPGHNKYLHLFFPPSAHEKDMFQVIATDVLDVVLEVWGTTRDDILFCKTLEGLWDYAKICASLNMSAHLDRMIQLMAAFTSKSLKNPENIIAVSEDMSKRSKKESGKDTIGNINPEYDLDELFGVDVRSLFQTRGIRKRDGVRDIGALKRIREGKHNSPSHANEKLKSSGSLMDSRNARVSQKNLYIYRGYILLRLLFCVCNEYIAHIQQGGWLAIGTLLSWARTQNALPVDLLELFEFKSGRGVTLNPSIFATAMKSNDSRRTEKERNKLMGVFRDKDERKSVWASVASLGGLLWQPQVRATTNDRLTSTLSSTSSSLPLTSAHDTATASLQQRSNNIHQLLLKSFQQCQLHSLLFAASKDLSPRGLDDMIWCLLSSVLADRSYIKTVICKPMDTSTSLNDEGFGSCGDEDSNDFDEAPSSLYSGRYRLLVWDFFGFEPVDISLANDTDSTNVVTKQASDVIQGDTVVVLEWVSRILFANRHRTSDVWSSFLQFLKMILESDGENLSSLCPYIVERAMTVALSLAIDAMPNQSVNNAASVRDVAGVWESLRMLRGIPHSIIFHCADRLGAGLLEFIRKCTINTEISAINTIDEWLLVFSLLSTATVGSLGRPYVWESICYIVDNNHITSSNFTSCRNLIFRFVYRVFPSDDENYNDVATKKSSQQPESKEHNPWLTGALLYQMRLTLMALGGYCLASALATAAHDEALRKAEQLYSAKIAAGSGHIVHNKTTSVPGIGKLSGLARTGDNKFKYMQFPLPVDDMSLSYNVMLERANGVERSDFNSLTSPGPQMESMHCKFSSSPLTNPSPVPTHTAALLGNSAPAPSTHNVIKVRCVEFSKVDDVELLWLESVKTFSDYVNMHPVEVSKNSTFCLKTIIYGAQVAEIPRKCWLEALTEMLSRLPLHAEKTISSFETQQLKQLQQEQNELAKKNEIESSEQSTFSLFSLGASRRQPAIASLSSSKLATLTAEGFDICLHCSVIVFDTLVFHFKLLRSYEEFRPFWLKYLSILAHNVVFSSRGSLIHDESVDMIGSLFRLLHQPDMPDQSYSQLLRMSWTAVKAICPAMYDLLELNHPNILAVLMEQQTQHQETHINNSVSNAIFGARVAPTNTKDTIVSSQNVPHVQSDVHNRPATVNAKVDSDNTSTPRSEEKSDSCIQNQHVLERVSSPVMPNGDVVNIASKSNFDIPLETPSSVASSEIVSEEVREAHPSPHKLNSQSEVSSTSKSDAPAADVEKKKNGVESIPTTSPIATVPPAARTSPSVSRDQMPVVKTFTQPPMKRFVSRNQIV